MIVRWNGSHVKAMRTARRDTQAQFAERLGVSIAVVSKWENRGTDQELLPKYAEMMDTAFSRLDAQQRRRFAIALGGDGEHHPHQSNQAEEIEDDDMQRRQLIVGSATAGAALLAGLPARGTRIRTGNALALAERVDSYNASEQRVGGGTLADAAATDFQQARFALDNFDIDAEAAEPFASAVGNMAVMAGWLHYDDDDQDKAVASYREALALAAQVGDDELATHTCLNMALQNITQARRGKANPQAALRYTLRAATLTQRHASGRIHALIASRQALAYAAMGDHGGFGRSIATAQREMDMAHEHEPLEECPLWLRFMSHNEVRYHQASGFAYLGEASKSADLFAVVATERAGQRNAANYRAWLAYSLSRVGDINVAVDEGQEVLKDLSGGVSSGRTLRVMESVRVAADPQRHQAFCNDYDALVTSA